MRAVGALMNDLRGGLAMTGPMNFILDGGEELLGLFGIGRVINAGRVNVQDLLVKAAF